MKWRWLLVLASSWSFAQPELSHDTVQVNLLLDLSRKDQWIDSYRSLNYADQALELSREINFPRGIAVAQNLRGFCFWSFGDNDLAIQSALEAIDIGRQEKDRSTESEGYYILARGYLDIGENKKAREAIARSEELATASPDWAQLCSIYNLRGVILFVDDKRDSALYYYNKAYEAGKAHGVHPINFPRIISNIGECYAPQHPALAFRYFTEALDLARETGNKIAEASITAIVGHAHLQERDIKNAEKELNEALALANSLGLRRVMRHAYAGLVDIALLQGDGDKAVVYLRTYYAVRDSLLNSSKIRQVVELEARHELQLKEQNIRLLENERQLQAIWNNLLIGAVVIVILLAAALLVLQRYRYRKNHEILNLEIDFLTKQNDVVAQVTSVNLSNGEGSIETQEQKLLKKAIAIVDAHISDPQLGVEKLAEELNMGRTSLHRKIKSITGFPPSELIRTIRLRKAARLIANRADTAAQIALMVGFEDYSHFSKAFKKHFGVSPSGYAATAAAQNQDNK
jgi:AraC-like DNA-binding protein